MDIIQTAIRVSEYQQGVRVRNVFEAAFDDAVLASNTSGIPISELGEFVPDTELVAGCHCWNPPYLLPLVEVVRGKARATPS